jgi:hypothetical protein
MITNFILSLIRFPAWLRKTKTENRAYFLEIIATFGVIATLLLNFLILKNDVIYGFFMLGVPLSAIILRLVRLFHKPSFKPTTKSVIRANHLPIAPRSAFAYPALAIFFICVVGSLLMIYGKNGWGPTGYDELAFLIIISVVQLIVYWFLKRNPARHPRLFDFLFFTLSYETIVAMYLFCLFVE